MRTQTIRGTTVPALGFGTWRLSGDQCRRAVAHALGVGYRHIDTAQMYGNEEHVGAAIAASGVDRDEIFLTTKIDNDAHAPDDVRSSTEESLRKLGTDHVDLLLMHWPVGDVPLETTLEAMSTLREEGLTRHIGVSNFTAEQVARVAVDFGIFANQVEYHPYLAQDDLVGWAQAEDHLLTAYSPIARGEVFDDDVLRDIAGTHDADPAQIALAWLIGQDHVAAIPRSSSEEHIESNLQAVEIDLSDDEMQRISDLDRGMRLVDPPFAPW